MATEPTLELSIIMPCLNEARTVGTCVQKAMRFLQEHQVQGEVIVADNGSSDGSREIAEQLGARVVAVPHRGYGNALKGGFAAAHGRFLIMGDADDSYDFTNLLPFLEQLRAGYDLVMGNRFAGGIAPSAMPPLHRYLGNPLLSGLGRLFFRTPARDFHCGLRGFARDAIERMDLQTTGMEFASEIVIKAALLQMKVCEVPTTLAPDGRDRPPHLRSWRDGWKHLRFMLIFSPRWLFLYPGIALMLLGTLLTTWTYFAPIRVGGVAFDIHSLAYFNALLLIGFNLVLFAVQSRLYAYRTRLIPAKPHFYGLLRHFSLESGLLVGFLMAVAGLGMSVWALSLWKASGFGGMQAASSMRIVLPAVTILIMGTQVIFSSFFLSILGLRSSFLDEREV